MKESPPSAPGDAVSAAIQAAAGQRRPALVGFLTAGFPSRRAFKANLAAVAAVCDVVEIGVPFSDPMADGTTIQRASFVALADGVTLPWILEELGSLQPKHAATVVRLDSLFAHSDGLQCRSIWDDRGRLDVAKWAALRSGLRVLSAMA